MAMYTAACGSYYGGFGMPAAHDLIFWELPAPHKERATWQRRQTENAYRLGKAKEKARRRASYRLKGKSKNNTKRYARR